MLSEISQQRKTNTIDITYTWNLKKAELLETKQNGGYQEPGNGGIGEKSLKYTNPQLEQE